MKEYDYVIVGGGISGIFAALALLDKKINPSILILERGPSMASRSEENIYEGFGGLGVSEGKYNISRDFGGRLKDYMGSDRLDNLLESLEVYLNRFGGQDSLDYKSDYIEGNYEGPISFIKNKVKHLGREKSLHLFKNISDYLEDRVDFIFDTKIENLEKISGNFIIQTRDEEFGAKKLIVASGNHSDFGQYVIEKFHLKRGSYQLDMGLRIETDAHYFDNILGDNLEVKLKYKDAYTYCMNKYGSVVEKTYNNYRLVDGQNFRESTKTDNLNFCLFKPYYFDSKQDMDEYLKSILEDLDGKVRASLLSDFNPKFTANSSIINTLFYEEADLSQIIPEDLLQLTNDFLEELENLCQKKLDGSSILYALDFKINSAQVLLDTNLQSQVEGLYFIGDVSGVTSSLAQAAASGLYLGTVKI